MTFQMRKVQPAGVKSVLYLAEMFPGVVLNTPVVVKVVAGKSVITPRGRGKTADFPQPSSFLPISVGSRMMRAHPWCKPTTCCSWFRHPLWDHCPLLGTLSTFPLTQNQKSQLSMKSRGKHDGSSWQTQPGSAQTQHHCCLQTPSSSLNIFHQGYKGMQSLPFNHHWIQVQWGHLLGFQGSG